MLPTELVTPRMQAGDIVLFRYWRARHINTDKYTDHVSPPLRRRNGWSARREDCRVDGNAGLAPAAAAGIRLPHYTLLSQGVLIAEHVTNLGSLADSAPFMFLGLNVAGWTARRRG